MKQLHKITVPTDFSENSLSAAVYALWLADNHQCSVHVLHVVHPETGDLDVPVISAQSTMQKVEVAEAVMATFVQSAIDKLESLYKPRHEVAIESSIRVGMPTNELMKFISEAESDMIVMGTRGKHNRLDQMFGSVTTSVLRKADVPVFIIPVAIHTLGIRTVGYATDLDPSEAMHIWKTGKLLQPFHSLMRIVHVHSSDCRHTYDIDDFKDFLGSSTLSLQTTFHQVKGRDVESALMEFSEDHELDVLAFHAPKRSWIERLWHHSVSRNLALFNKTPMLSIR